MSVLPSDLVAYGSAYMPEADGTTVGGAVDFSRRVAFYDITPAGTINFVSSSATDMRVQIQVAGRDFYRRRPDPGGGHVQRQHGRHRLAELRAALVRRRLRRFADRPALRPAGSANTTISANITISDNS